MLTPDISETDFGTLQTKTFYGQEKNSSPISSPSRT
ncbi:hypothetical protein [Octadecabacter antarcticus]